MASRSKSGELIKALNELCSERGIEPEVIFEALEAALVAAYKRNFASAQNVQVNINHKTGKVGVYAQKTVVEEIAEGMSQMEITLADAR